VCGVRPEQYRVNYYSRRELDNPGTVHAPDGMETASLEYTQMHVQREEEEEKSLTVWIWQWVKESNTHLFPLLKSLVTLSKIF